MSFIAFLSSQNRPSPHENDKLLNGYKLHEWLAHYPILSIEYDALCRTLTYLLIELKEQSDLGVDILPLAPILSKTLERASEFNKLLIETYRYTGLHRGAITTLEAQQKTLAQLKSPTPKNSARASATLIEELPLKKRTLWDRLKAFFLYIFTNIQEELNSLRVKTSRGNPRRLFLSRLRRFFLNIKVILASYPESLQNFKRGYQPIDLVFGWVMNILSWLFLLPRLLINIYFTAWHVIIHNGLSEAEKKLTWRQRLKLQIQERKWEFANELVWVPGGILTCFILIGSLSMIGVYLTVTMFVWDILVSGMRAYQELGRLSKVITEHQNYLLTLSNPNEKEIHQKFINQLLAHQTYERKRHALSIFNNILVTLCTFLALSCVLLPVVVPLIASCCLLILTIFTVVMGNRINEKKPPNSLSSVSAGSYLTVLDSCGYSIERPSLGCGLTPKFYSSVSSTDWPRAETYSDVALDQSSVDTLLSPENRLKPQLS